MIDRLIPTPERLARKSKKGLLGLQYIQHNVTTKSKCCVVFV